MTAESVLLAICLRLLLHLQRVVMQAAGPAPANPAGTLIGYLGAGIYEELLFRLILLGLLYFFQRLRRRMMKEHAA